jgi:hypothetical protein
MLYDRTGPDDAVESAADDHGYDFILWEIEHFPRKWAYKLHNLFRSDSGPSDEDAISRYFELTEEIAGLRDREFAGAGLEEDLLAERQRLEPHVEDILEGRMTAVLEGQNLALEPPLFSDLGLIFPPVDFELDSPPRVLAVSPRDRIALERSFLLEPGLQRDEFAAIEDKAEANNNDEDGVASLVVGTSGVSTYPSVISADDDYAGMVETAFHEWLHQYLTFFPLGRSYFQGGDAKTLNESVASLGGQELARLYFEKYGSLQEDEQPIPSSAPSAAAFNFTEEMRELRREVETLLADGKITEAEALMEQRRLDFQDHGYFLRRLNQAYFAFHGFYAFSPGSTDPIGPKLQNLLDERGSPGAFLRAARGITSRAELDQALAAGG